MAKIIAFDQKPAKQFARGSRNWLRAVKVTWVLRDATSFLQKSFGSPTDTKDGVNRCNRIDLEDVYENLRRSSYSIAKVASKPATLQAMVPPPQL